MIYAASYTDQDGNVRHLTQDQLYECPWGCPFVIFPEDAEYHREWHTQQGENPDIRGGKL